MDSSQEFSWGIVNLGIHVILPWIESILWVCDCLDLRLSWNLDVVDCLFHSICYNYVKVLRLINTAFQSNTNRPLSNSQRFLVHNWAGGRGQVLYQRVGPGSLGPCTGGMRAMLLYRRPSSSFWTEWQTEMTINITFLQIHRWAEKDFVCLSVFPFGCRGLTLSRFVVLVILSSYRSGVYG